jgi:formylmethanofuran dehydrogenase subunit E
MDPGFSELRERVITGRAGGEDRRLYQERLDAICSAIITSPPETIFSWQHLQPRIPERARIYGSVRCDLCGEMVAEHRIRKRDGQNLCIPCAGEEGSCR